MSNAYDVENFELDYCQQNISKIAAAIQNKASLLVIGMPGCGKSRLIDFFLNRPGVLEKHGLSDALTFVQVDGDMITTAPRGVYFELLRAVGSDVDRLGESSLDLLQNHLISAIRKLEASRDLVIIFDNFTSELQQALGQSFFNFLFALRNSRSKLNLVYIFMANLKVDFSGFYKMERLFDRGADRSICWLAPLNQKDSFFSINRQLHKAGATPDSLSQAHKERISQLAGGHALLLRHLTHLMLSGDLSLQTELDRVLTYSGLQAACEAIWNDLDQSSQDRLIDLVTKHTPAQDATPPDKFLENYGILKEETRFHSLLFEHFVKQRERPKVTLELQCDKTQTQLVIKRNEQARLFPLQGLSARKKRLLCCLLENQGQTCHKDQLIIAGWPADDGQGVSDQALSRQIDGLRTWLKKATQVAQYLTLETVWGEGYRLQLND